MNYLEAVERRHPSLMPANMNCAECSNARGGATYACKGLICNPPQQICKTSRDVSNTTASEALGFELLSFGIVDLHLFYWEFKS